MRSNGKLGSTRTAPGGFPRDLFLSTKGEVYGDLREAIIVGSLAPGQKVSESEIASQLGVSRTPAREALAALREEGLVKIVPQLGTFVTPINGQDVADAVFARQALECAAIRLAAAQPDSAGLAALHENLEEQEIAADAGDLLTFDSLDEDLHRLLCDLSGHGIAWSLSRRVTGHLDRARELGLRDPAMLGKLLQVHHEIVDAVATKQPDLAERLLFTHLQQLLKVLPKVRRIYPMYFEDGQDPVDGGA
jgi:DNA-binding GntR family transcriptional regulator